MVTKMENSSAFFLILNVFITRNWSALCQCLCLADAKRLHYYIHWCAFCEYEFVFDHTALYLLTWNDIVGFNPVLISSPLENISQEKVVANSLAWHDSHHGKGFKLSEPLRVG